MARLKHFYVTPELHSKVKAAAAIKGIKIQDFVKAALEKAL